MFSVVRQIGEQGFVNIKHPGIHPIIFNLNASRKPGSFPGSHLKIKSILLSRHVAFDIARTLHGNRCPGPQIIGLTGKPPTFAPQPHIIIARRERLHVRVLDDHRPRNIRVPTMDVIDDQRCTSEGNEEESIGNSAKEERFLHYLDWA